VTSLLGIENSPTIWNILEDRINNVKSYYGILWKFLVCSLQYIRPVCTCNHYDFYLITIESQHSSHMVSHLVQHQFLSTEWTGNHILGTVLFLREKTVRDVVN
jgi:hypothetical protein